ncbi:MAG: response regulator, partial [Candidatus Omnitrophota bacterium]
GAAKAENSNGAGIYCGTCVLPAAVLKAKQELKDEWGRKTQNLGARQKAKLGVIAWGSMPRLLNIIVGRILDVEEARTNPFKTANSPLSFDNLQSTIRNYPLNAIRYTLNKGSSSIGNNREDNGNSRRFPRQNGGELTMHAINAGKRKDGYRHQPSGLSRDTLMALGIISETMARFSKRQADAAEKMADSVESLAELAMKNPRSLEELLRRPLRQKNVSSPAINFEEKAVSLSELNKIPAKIIRKLDRILAVLGRGDEGLKNVARSLRNIMGELPLNTKEQPLTGFQKREVFPTMAYINNYLRKARGSKAICLVAGLRQLLIDYTHGKIMLYKRMHRLEQFVLDGDFSKVKGVSSIGPVDDARQEFVDIELPILDIALERFDFTVEDSGDPTAETLAAVGMVVDNLISKGVDIGFIPKYVRGDDEKIVRAQNDTVLLRRWVSSADNRAEAELASSAVDNRMKTSGSLSTDKVHSQDMFSPSSMMIGDPNSYRPKAIYLGLGSCRLNCDICLQGKKFKLCKNHLLDNPAQVVNFVRASDSIGMIKGASLCIGEIFDNPGYLFAVLEALQDSLYKNIRVIQFVTNGLFARDEREAVNMLKDARAYMDDSLTVRFTLSYGKAHNKAGVRASDIVNGIVAIKEVFPAIGSIAIQRVKMLNDDTLEELLVALSNRNLLKEQLCQVLNNLDEAEGVELKNGVKLTFVSMSVAKIGNAESLVPGEDYVYKPLSKDRLRKLAGKDDVIGDSNNAIVLGCDGKLYPHEVFEALSIMPLGDISDLTGYLRQDVYSLEGWIGVVNRHPVLSALFSAGLYRILELYDEYYPRDNIFGRLPMYNEVVCAAAGLLFKDNIVRENAARLIGGSSPLEGEDKTALDEKPRRKAVITAHTEEAMNHTKNQDAHIVWRFDDAFVIGVFDGIGGMMFPAKASKIAATTVHEKLEDIFKRNTMPDLKDSLVEAVKQGERELKTRLIEYIAGTTFTVVAGRDNGNGLWELCAVSGGDARAYLLTPDGELKFMTVDDYMPDSEDGVELTLSDIQRIAEENGQEFLSNVSSREELSLGGPGMALKFDMRHQTENYLSSAEQLYRPVVTTAAVKAGFTLLACTDGLHNQIPHDKIRELLISPSGNTAVELVEAANRSAIKKDFRAKKNSDDITVVVAKVSSSSVREDAELDKFSAFDIAEEELLRTMREISGASSPAVDETSSPVAWFWLMAVERNIPAAAASAVSVTPDSEELPKESGLSFIYINEIEDKAVSLSPQRDTFFFGKDKVTGQLRPFVIRQAVIIKKGAYDVVDRHKGFLDKQEELAARIMSNEKDSPAVIIAGERVEGQDYLDWFKGQLKAFDRRLASGQDKAQRFFWYDQTEAALKMPLAVILAFIAFEFDEQGQIGAPVGAARASVCPRTCDYQYHFSFDNLEVLPSHRDKGIGKALAERLLLYSVMKEIRACTGEEDARNFIEVTKQACAKEHPLTFITGVLGIPPANPNDMTDALTSVRPIRIYPTAGDIFKSLKIYVVDKNIFPVMSGKVGIRETIFKPAIAGWIVLMGRLHEKGVFKYRNQAYPLVLLCDREVDFDDESVRDSLESALEEFNAIAKTYGQVAVNGEKIISGGAGQSTIDWYVANILEHIERLDVATGKEEHLPDDVLDKIRVISSQETEQVMRAMGREERVEHGKTLWQAGGAADGFIYILDRGEFAGASENGHTRRYGSGECVGIVDLLNSLPRVETVRCVSKGGARVIRVGIDELSKVWENALDMAPRLCDDPVRYLVLCSLKVMAKQQLREWTVKTSEDKKCWINISPKFKRIIAAMLDDRNTSCALETAAGIRPSLKIEFRRRLHELTDFASYIGLVPHISSDPDYYGVFVNTAKTFVLRFHLVRPGEDFDAVAQRGEEIYGLSKRLSREDVRVVNIKQYFSVSTFYGDNEKMREMFMAEGVAGFDIIESMPRLVSGREVEGSIEIIATYVNTWLKMRYERAQDDKAEAPHLNDTIFVYDHNGAARFYLKRIGIPSFSGLMLDARIFAAVQHRENKQDPEKARVSRKEAVLVLKGIWKGFSGYIEEKIIRSVNDSDVKEDQLYDMLKVLNAYLRQQKMADQAQVLSYAIRGTLERIRNSIAPLAAELASGEPCEADVAKAMKDMENTVDEFLLDQLAYIDGENGSSSPAACSSIGQENVSAINVTFASSPIEFKGIGVQLWSAIQRVSKVVKPQDRERRRDDAKRDGPNGGGNKASVTGDRVAISEEGRDLSRAEKKKTSSAVLALAREDDAGILISRIDELAASRESIKGNVSSSSLEAIKIPDEIKLRFEILRLKLPLVYDQKKYKELLGEIERLNQAVSRDWPEMGVVEKILADTFTRSGETFINVDLAGNAFYLHSKIEDILRGVEVGHEDIERGFNIFTATIDNICAICELEGRIPLEEVDGLLLLASAVIAENTAAVSSSLTKVHISDKGLTKKSQTSSPAAERKKVRILLADDSGSVRESMVNLLAVAGFNQALITEAGDGAAAFSKFDEGDFDIVISDYNMPEKNGIQLYCEIRGTRKSDAPFLLNSNKKLAHILPSGLELRNFRFFQKGDDADILIACIDELLASRESIAERASSPLSARRVKAAVLVGLVFVVLISGCLPAQIEGTKDALSINAPAGEKQNVLTSAEELMRKVNQDIADGANRFAVIRDAVEIASEKMVSLKALDKLRSNLDLWLPENGDSKTHRDRIYVKAWITQAEIRIQTIRELYNSIVSSLNQGTAVDSTKATYLALQAKYHPLAETLCRRLRQEFGFDVRFAAGENISLSEDKIRLGRGGQGYSDSPIQAVRHIALPVSQAVSSGISRKGGLSLVRGVVLLIAVGFFTGCAAPQPAVDIDKRAREYARFEVVETPADVLVGTFAEKINRIKSRGLEKEEEYKKIYDEVSLVTNEARRGGNLEALSLLTRNIPEWLPALRNKAINAKGYLEDTECGNIYCNVEVGKRQLNYKKLAKDAIHQAQSEVKFSNDRYKQGLAMARAGDIDGARAAMFYLRQQANYYRYEAKLAADLEKEIAAPKKEPLKKKEVKGSKEEKPVLNAGQREEQKIEVKNRYDLALAELDKGNVEAAEKTIELFRELAKKRGDKYAGALAVKLTIAVREWEVIKDINEAIKKAREEGDVKELMSFKGFLEEQVMINPLFKRFVPEFERLID